MNPVRRFADAGRGAWQDLPGPQNTVMGMRALAGGRLVLGAQDPAWSILSSAGKRVLGREREIADLRHVAEAFRVAADGRAVHFSFSERTGRRPALFSVPDRRLRVNPPATAGLAAPRLASKTVKVTDWKNTREPRLNGEPLPLDPYETSRSLAVAPDGESFILGTEWHLRAWNHDGASRWVTEAPAAVWHVNVSGDGRLVVAALGDGTIRWYRYHDGAELLAFLPHRNGRRWVLWTPAGDYDASPGGADLIGWHVNDGADRAAKFHPAGKLSERYHRPRVIDQALTPSAVVR